MRVIEAKKFEKKVVNACLNGYNISEKRIRDSDVHKK